MTMKARPRIDLDGVPLVDTQKPDSKAVAIFRYRTTGGLVLLIPESADFTVDWSHIDDCTIDLADGKLRVAFEQQWAASQNWLRGAEKVEGTWTDRLQMKV